MAAIAFMGSLVYSSKSDQHFEINFPTRLRFTLDLDSEQE